jgi:hypothetical protein
MKQELTQHFANMIFSFVVLYKSSTSRAMLSSLQKRLRKREWGHQTGVLLLCQSKAYCSGGGVAVWRHLGVAYIFQDVKGEKHSHCYDLKRKRSRKICPLAWHVKNKVISCLFIYIFIFCVFIYSFISIL